MDNASASFYTDVPLLQIHYSRMMFLYAVTEKRKVDKHGLY